MTDTARLAALLAEALDGVLPRMAFHKYGQFYNDDPDFDIEVYYLRVAESLIADHPDLFTVAAQPDEDRVRCDIPACNGLHERSHHHVCDHDYPTRNDRCAGCGVTVAAQPAPDALAEGRPEPLTIRRLPGEEPYPFPAGHVECGWCQDYGYTDGFKAGRETFTVVARPAPDALRAAAQEHGLCSCADFGGPRPLGNGQEYHYVGCDYDPALRAALGDKP